MKDDLRAMQYLMRQGCVQLRAGLPVSVLDRSWTGWVKFRVYSGSSAQVLWGPMEGISKGDAVAKPNAQTLANAPSYEITGDLSFPDVKRSVTVRISEPTSKTILRSIALKIKSQQQRECPSTFITFYLPGQTPEDGSWATTHFNPNLKVRIY